MILVYRRSRTFITDWFHIVGITKIDPSLYEDLVDRHLGREVVTSLQLCSMFKKNELTGYYKILHQASFGKKIRLLLEFFLGFGEISYLSDLVRNIIQQYLFGNSVPLSKIWWELFLRVSFWWEMCLNYYSSKSALVIIIIPQCKVWS